MGVIITIPAPYADADNPTADEQAAHALYETRGQVVRDRFSPDLTIRFTAERIPNSIVFEAGALLICEQQVMADSGYDTAQIQALAADSTERIALVSATQNRRAIQLLPQAAQMIREGLLGDSRQFQEIDWEKREARLEAEYQDAIKVVNPDAVFDARDALDDFAVVTTKSRALERR